MGDIVIVIPARYRSVRFPGKPLFEIAGKPLVRWVWERCLRVRGCAGAIVATDDERIAEVARGFGARVAMTSSRHRTGTERVAEVAAGLRGVDGVLNVQGDEPLVSPRLLERMIREMRAAPGLEMVTAAVPFAPGEDPSDPNRVKVVLDAAGDALYFSRARIPHDRDGVGVRHLLHLGLYGYRRDFLLRLVRLRPPPVERAECLEQLRALHHRARIRVLVTRLRAFGVDTPEDAAKMEGILGGRGRCGRRVEGGR